MRPNFMVNLCSPYPVQNIWGVPTRSQRCSGAWVKTEPIASKPGISRVGDNINMCLPLLIARTAIKHEVANRSPCSWYFVPIKKRKQTLDVISFFQRLSVECIGGQFVESSP